MELKSNLLNAKYQAPNFGKLLLTMAVKMGRRFKFEINSIYKSAKN